MLVISANRRSMTSIVVNTNATIHHCRMNMMNAPQSSRRWRWHHASGYSHSRMRVNDLHYRSGEIICEGSSTVKIYIDLITSNIHLFIDEKSFPWASCEIDSLSVRNWRTRMSTWCMWCHRKPLGGLPMSTKICVKRGLSSMWTSLYCKLFSPSNWNLLVPVYNSLALE